MTPSNFQPKGQDVTNSRIRILIAEDHRAYASTLSKLIRQKLSPLLDLVEIEHTDSLKEALRMSQTCDVSIVDAQLTDCTPEEMEAALPDFRKPVIVLTAHYTPQLEDRCLMGGAHAVFSKEKFDKVIEALLTASIHGLAREMAA
jgi:DNA-binding NarL/FixJ family response regulator